MNRNETANFAKDSAAAGVRRRLTDEILAWQKRTADVVALSA